MNKFEVASNLLKGALIGEAALAASVVPATLGVAMYEGMESRVAYEQGDIAKGDSLAAQANQLQEFTFTEAEAILGSTVLASGGLIFVELKKNRKEETPVVPTV